MFREMRLFFVLSLRVISLTVVFVIFLIVTTACPQDLPGYHTYDEMTATIRKVVNSHKNIAKLVSIGKTLEERDIWLVEIANPEGVTLDRRPALFIGANFEGDHLIGSEISLFIIDYLLSNYSSRPEVKSKIDNNVFYILPRANPDAAEMMFAKTKTGRKTNTKPYDSDKDGRTDEDGPEDLNNDGFITVMRSRDTEGEYIVDPDEPRLMKKADPKKGESGIYQLYWEGIDNDKDDYINEDPSGGVDINRNFQHEYPYYKPDVGWHMISENESRAIMDWILSHRNVAIILTFGESDNLIVAPNSNGKLGPAREIDLYAFAEASNDGADKVGMFGTGRRGSDSVQSQREQAQADSRSGRKPVTDVDTTDVEYFRMISKKYGELTGIKNQPPVRQPEGAFFQFGYYQFGVPSFSTPGWGITVPAPDSTKGESKKSPDNPGMIQTDKKNAADSKENQDQGKTDNVDRQMLRWMDSEGIDGFAAWAAFKHPEHGEVEIGGFKPYAVTNPPASKIAELGASHAEFALYLSTLFPQVKIAKTEVTNHGGGIFRIKAEVENTGFLPSSLAHGVTSRSVKPTMVQLEVDPEAIITGDNKTSFFQSLTGSGNRRKYEWLIKGKPGTNIELRVVSQKGGTDAATITLK